MCKLNLVQPILYLVTDNTQSNYVLPRELQSTALVAKWQPEQFQTACVAHVLELASKAFIENLEYLIIILATLMRQLRHCINLLWVPLAAQFLK